MVYINNPGHMTKMAAISIYGKKPFKNCLLRNRWINFNKTLHVELWTRVLQCSINSPFDDLELLYGKFNIGRP